MRKLHCRRTSLTSFVVDSWEVRTTSTNEKSFIPYKASATAQAIKVCPVCPAEEYVWLDMMRAADESLQLETALSSSAHTLHCRFYNQLQHFGCTLAWCENLVSQLRNYVTLVLNQKACCVSVVVYTAALLEV